MAGFLKLTINDISVFSSLNSLFQTNALTLRIPLPLYSSPRKYLDVSVAHLITWKRKWDPWVFVYALMVGASHPLVSGEKCKVVWILCYCWHNEWRSCWYFLALLCPTLECCTAESSWSQTMETTVISFCNVVILFLTERVKQRLQKEISSPHVHMALATMEQFYVSGQVVKIIFSPFLIWAALTSSFEQ